MGNRSVIQSLKVDKAAKRHYCRYNKKHVINKGDKRLEIKVGRSKQTYCVNCGVKFVTNGISGLTATLDQLND